VAAITEQLCGLVISSDQVEQDSSVLDEEIRGCRDRPVGETHSRILQARYERPRRGGSVIPCAVPLALGVQVT
jgi:putative transposase